MISGNSASILNERRRRARGHFGPRSASTASSSGSLSSATSRSPARPGPRTRDPFRRRDPGPDRRSPRRAARQGQVGVVEAVFHVVPGCGAGRHSDHRFARPRFANRSRRSRAPCRWERVDALVRCVADGGVQRVAEVTLHVELGVDAGVPQPQRHLLGAGPEQVTAARGRPAPRSRRPDPGDVAAVGDVVVQRHPQVELASSSVSVRSTSLAPAGS